MHCIPLADDCGFSDSNVTAITRCIDANALRGASLMACGAAVEKAAVMLGGRLAQNPGLRLGVHLNLLEGSCSSDPTLIPLLANRDGTFRHSLGGLCLKLETAGKGKKSALAEQAALEWNAQVSKIHALLRAATGWDKVPLYLDGHQHVHAIPALLPALGTLLENITPVHVRIPEEPRYYCPAPSGLQAKGTIRRELLAFWGRSLRQFLAARGVTGPDFFIGAFCSGAMTLERMGAGLAKVHSLAYGNSTVEIMFHPGLPGEEEKIEATVTDVFSRFYAARERTTETNLLLSPAFRQALAKYDPSWQPSDSA